MKKIVIIGANDFQNPLILKAQEMGYETHVFAWKDNAVGEKTADYFYPISIVEKKAILEVCRKIEPSAVISIASDLAAITVNYLAEELGLPGNSAECVRVTTNKFEMRKKLMENGVMTPRFYKINVGEKYDYEKMIDLPAIVKPTDRSGSRGITKIFKYGNINAAVNLAAGQSFEKAAILEEYIEGNEYSCECITYQGEHHLLAITKKYTTGSPHFIETGHIEPSGLSNAEENEVKKVVFKALTALMVRNSASHTEFKIGQDGKIRIIEIGARMGGDCIGSQLVQMSTGYDFVKMTIEVAEGVSPTLEKRHIGQDTGIKFIFEPKDYEEYIHLKESNPQMIVFESDICRNKVVSDSSTRWGFYILRGSRENIIGVLEGH